MKQGGHVDCEAVLGALKGFQRSTAEWAFARMFDEGDPSLRFLVADEVGLGKTHVAKGVIAQAIDHLDQAGDVRHDIVYVCSNAAIARQNLRKLVPKGVEPLDDVERLTMLPLTKLDQGDGERSGLNLLAITPGTSLKLGRNTGRFAERCLVYTFLRAHWGPAAMIPRARRIFWEGVSPDDGDSRLCWREEQYREAVKRALPEFVEVLDEIDAARTLRGDKSLRSVFDRLVEGLAYKRSFPDELKDARRDLIGEVRRAMAITGIASLQPDLVVLDEFQRFKDLLEPDPENFAAELAHRLFDHVDVESGRPTRTLLLSATPYRMYATSDEIEGDNYGDFVATCRFLIQDEAKVKHLRANFGQLRDALTTAAPADRAEQICQRIAAELRQVMVRTERLAATPDRDGMLRQLEAEVEVRSADLQSYVRFADLAEAVGHHEPTSYWKSGPYLVNFMERYEFKRLITRNMEELRSNGQLTSGPGILDWDEIEAYEQIDPQNGRLRWLLEDLAAHHAFDLAWIPPSLRYYDAGSVYETESAQRFTKRLIFSSWALVPKVVSALTSFEAERHAFTHRNHDYSADYARRGGQRLTFRTEARSGEGRRAAAMSAFLLVWPSVTLAKLGDPRPFALSERPALSNVVGAVEARLRERLAPLRRAAPTGGAVDQSWYWAAPLLLDNDLHSDITDGLLAGPEPWEGDDPSDGLQAHLSEARAIVSAGGQGLGRPPDDLERVLAEVALGGPAVCALRSISSVSGLPITHEATLSCATRVAEAFRRFFNAPEVTAVVAGDARDSGRYWREVVRHSISGSLQALLDEHCHVLRDWRGHLQLDDEDRKVAATDEIASSLAEALELRTSSVGADIPGREAAVRMRTRFAVAFGTQVLDEGGQARVESLSTAFNSPFWPFVMTSTSVGQEGLDFHLWCHAVCHWNLPSNPVDLEQREGRVHRYKGHAVRRNVAAEVSGALHHSEVVMKGDLWDQLFRQAATLGDGSDEMSPYWVFEGGPAKVERHVPILPFSSEAAALPRLRKALAAYRIAFGQPRQEELIEFLGDGRSEAELVELAARLRIDLSPPASVR